MDERDLLLADFSPRSSLKRTPQIIDRPRFPVVDVHNHLGGSFPGVRDTPSAQLIEVLDEVGVEAIVDLDGGQGADLTEEIEHWRAIERILVFAGLDYPMWATEARFGEVEARRLRDSVDRGAKGLKIWKTLGLRARDPDGRLVGVDDNRLDPLFETAAELQLPILIHVGDPFAFFQPLDRNNERWEELSANPDWHFWPTTRNDDPEPGTFPMIDVVLAGLERLVGRHPSVAFIGAHVASAAEDLAYVSGLLDRHPNLYIDISERISELGRQPYSARSFLIRHSQRVLFGLDRPCDPALYRLHYRFLETFDESFAYGLEAVPRQGRWQIHGLGLPDDVLGAIYNANARRILWPTTQE
jgi:predicted TIM-barrel fold metal-dependent hydrolase